MKTPTIAALAIALLLAACSTTTNDTTTTVTDAPAPNPIDLAGTRWVADAMFLGGAQAPLVPRAQPTLDFAADGLTLGGTTGCNSYGGEYSLGSGTITIGALSQTEMACEEPLMQQEANVLSILADATVITLEDGVLSVGRLGGSMLQFVDRAVAFPGAELTGTRWIADTLIRGGAAMTLVPGSEVTLLLDAASSEATGSAGCNTFTASFESDRTQVTFGPIVATEIGCEQQAIMEQEAFVLATLGGEMRAEIDGTRLTLTAKTGDAISFRAAE